MTVTSATTLAPFAQADLLQIAAALFSRPSERTVLELPSDDDVRELVAAAGFAPELSNAAAEALAAAVSEARLCGAANWRIEHDRLFEGAMICPFNESMFVRRDKGAILADITAFHRAFGVSLNTAAGEKADHLVAELELLAWLLVLSGKAEAEGRERDAETARHAVSAFAVDHLGEWLPAFTRHVAAQYALPVVPLSAVALLAVWRALSAVHGWPDAEAVAAAQAAGDQGTPYECGMAEQEQVQQQP